MLAMVLLITAFFGAQPIFVQDVELKSSSAPLMSEIFRDREAINSVYVQMEIKAYDARRDSEPRFGNLAAWYLDGAIAFRLDLKDKTWIGVGPTGKDGRTVKYGQSGLFVYDSLYRLKRRALVDCPDPRMIGLIPSNFINFPNVPVESLQPFTEVDISDSMLEGKPAVVHRFRNMHGSELQVFSTIDFSQTRVSVIAKDEQVISTTVIDAKLKQVEGIGTFPYECRFSFAVNGEEIKYEEYKIECCKSGTIPFDEFAQNLLNAIPNDTIVEWFVNKPAPGKNMHWIDGDIVADSSAINGEGHAPSQFYWKLFVFNFGVIAVIAAFIGAFRLIRRK